MNKFAVFDIDGTLFRSSLYIELASELAADGLLDSDLIADIATKRKTWSSRQSDSAYEEFDSAVAMGIDGLLPTIPVAQYELAVARTISNNADKIYSYTRKLITTLKSKGYKIIAVSGSPKELVEQFVAHYDFDIWVGQHWIQENGAFTGEMVKTHTNKDVIVKKLIEDYNLTLEGSYAVGDTEGDIGILSMVDHPIAFNPTYGLIKEAEMHGWPLVIERKNICYTLHSELPGGAYALVDYNRV
ncbi:MAG TPA: HAD family phosphatase [Candidatus Saccharimonas sp.]|nr:HAD family phosphatase [Candidatus Saccharimonas sp.]